MAAVPEGEEGVDLEKLEESIDDFERERGGCDLKVGESFSLVFELWILHHCFHILSLILLCHHVPFMDKESAWS
jgi:hypothetical protein